MRSMKSFFGFKKIQKKYLFMVAVLGLLSVVTISTYAFFVITAGGYTASELLVAELAYGISIVDDDGNPINGNTVMVAAGDKQYFDITISSVNKIDSKYTLGYKSSNSTTVVKYTDKTPWSSQGVINGYDETTTYAKKIRVVVDNSEVGDGVTVTFGVFGGYTFNGYPSISLGDGYFTVGGPYNELVAVKSSKLVDLVEENTGCITADAGTCMYSGGAINNYLQYPESDTEGKNLWRIMGTYHIGDQVVAKLISESTGTTSLATLGTDLDSFYKTLDNPGLNIYKTNMFNCTESGCTTSDYENIGLISTYEYNKVGGVNSYLEPTNPYFALNGASINNITSSGILSDSLSTSGLRPSVYLQNGVKVTGSGTYSDPYVISPQGDINLMAYTIGGEEPKATETYAWALANKVVDTVTCTNGTVAEWDYSNNTIKLSKVNVPTYCTIDFKDGYLVNLKVNNGTITAGGSSQAVGYNGTVKFTVKANTDYMLSGSKVTCSPTSNGSATINATTGEVTVSGVVGAVTCTVDMAADKLTLYAQILADHPTVNTRTSFSSVFGSSTATTGVIYRESTYREDTSTSAANNKDVYYFAGNVADNWVKFAGKYWRIIRTNEDGSIRLLYHGTSTTATDSYIQTSYAYNPTYNNTMYVGYMYGSTGSLASNRGYTNSPQIKTKLESWYSSDIASYDNAVSKTAIYCNDRAGDAYAATGTMYYAAYKRLIDNKRPTYKCGGSATSTSLYGDASSADRFSKSTASGGNGQLSQPIGLMTADEVAFAGGVYGTNSPYAYYYLNSSGGSSTGSYWWWTMSPNHFYGSYAYVFRVHGSSYPGQLYYTSVGNTGAVRPVLSLKSCVLVSKGNGTAANPYEIEVSGTCATADN